MLAEETGLSVIVSENALNCVASGAGLLLEDANLRATMIAA
jgi:actin-like ATPase involved in cell morphogenesis